MPGRMYTVAGNASVTAAVDLAEIVAAATTVCIIHGVEVQQTSDTDTETLAVQIKSGQTSSGTGGTTTTPGRNTPGDAAASFTAEVFNTGKAASGTIVTHAELGFNVLNGWLWLPTPEKRIVLAPSRRLTVELVGAPVDALTMRITVDVEEVG